MKFKNWIFLAATFTLAGLSWQFLREYKAVKSFRPNSWVEDHSADCAVVLTGGPGRVREGMDLLAQGRVQKLIISGVHPGASLREIFPEFPFYGLQKDDVILERRSGTTYGNAQQTLVLVEALHCRDLILVTSYLHMHRASRTFGGVFPPEFPLISRATVSGPLGATWWDLVLEAAKSFFYSLWAY